MELGGRSGYLSLCACLVTSRRPIFGKTLTRPARPATNTNTILPRVQHGRAPQAPLRIAAVLHLPTGKCHHGDHIPISSDFPSGQRPNGAAFPLRPATKRPRKPLAQSPVAVGVRGMGTFGLPVDVPMQCHLIYPERPGPRCHRSASLPASINQYR